MKRIAGILGLIVSATFSALSASTLESVAADKAKAWLAIVDGRHYAESWDETAQSFKGQIARDVWAKKLEELRAPMGAVRSRRFIEAIHSETKACGNCVRVRFLTDFEHQEGVVETVTPKWENSEWQINGYFVK